MSKKIPLFYCSEIKFTNKQKENYGELLCKYLVEEEVGRKYFQEGEINPVGTLESFSRRFKRGKRQNEFKKWALKAESRLPPFLKRSLTRSQLIIYREPYKA